MKTIALSIISLFVFNVVLIAQTPSNKHSPVLEEANPSEVGMSPERLTRFDANHWHNYETNPRKSG